jgi:ABC-type amino acid transport substrate-binding protein
MMFAYIALAFSVTATQAYVLNVSTFEEPPFAMYNVGTNKWTGYNIDMMDYLCT